MRGSREPQEEFIAAQAIEENQSTRSRRMGEFIAAQAIEKISRASVVLPLPFIAAQAIEKTIS